MLWLHTPSPVPNSLHVVGLGTTDGSGHRTLPTHLNSTLLVGLRVSASSMDPSGESLSARVDQATFSSESSTPNPKGVTDSIGVATRNSWLWCTVLMFPASSFTSYAGMSSVTWQTTTYSVSLHWSLISVSLGMHHSSSVPHCLVLIVQYSWFCHSTIFVFWLHNLFGGAPQHRSSNLHHICGHMMGAFECTHCQEVIINREVRVPPKH